MHVQHSQMTGRGNERAAFLQAGHAVGACLYGIPVVRVSIIPTDGADSWIEVTEPMLPNFGTLIDERDRIAARALIVALLAGPAAGQRYSFGSSGTDMSSCRGLLTDPCVWRAANLARRVGAGKSTLRLLWREAALIADQDDNWSVVNKLAMDLLCRREIDGEEVEQITGKWFRAPCSHDNDC